MSMATGTQDIQVSIASDGSEATLSIPADFPRQLATASYCQNRVRAGGVEVTAQVAAAIEKLLAAMPPQRTQVQAVVARRIEPKHGSGGAIEWNILSDAALTASVPQPSEPPQADKAKPFSFYDCSAFTVVKAGQILGREIPATAGEDGRDLVGHAIKAKPGKPTPTKLDASLLRDATGRLIAQIDGVLQRTPQLAKIDPILDIPGDIDFSTGNVEFKGDVIVRGGVRGGFAISAQGNVEVHGIIEAATIQCGGTLVAHGGIAGHERAKVTVGQHLFAKYLDNIASEIGGDFQVEREVINCELIVKGSVRMPHSSLIGGRLVVTGDVEIGTIGSGAGVITSVVFGSVPLLETKQRDLDKQAADLALQLQLLRKEQQFLVGQQRALSPQQKERMTEVMFELDQEEKNLAKVQADKKEIGEAINQSRRVKFTVQRKLHQGARLTIRDQQYRIDADTAGPLSIGLDLGANPVFSRNGLSLPLGQIARLIR